MKKTTSNMLHIMIIMFMISLITGLQAPVFTPFAATFGATSLLIGIMLSLSSFTDLIGNLIAGPFIDKYGRKLFISLPLLLAGLLFIAHGFAYSSMNLLVIRALNGFVLAFLMPAAFTLLSSFAKNNRQQGRNMSIYGILATISSITAPVIGGNLVRLFGYENTYFIIGTALILTFIYSINYLTDDRTVVLNFKTNNGSQLRAPSFSRLIQVYWIGFAVMYIHGVVIYEIPYLTVEQGVSTVNTGKLFSFMGIGTFVTLSLLFINNFNPYKRLMLGLLGMSMTMYAIIISLLPLTILLFFVGLFFGLIMPAMATVITDKTPHTMHGRAFGVLSAVYSLGMIISTFTTGLIRDFISPYFIAFVVGMAVLIIAGPKPVKLATKKI